MKLRYLIYICILFTKAAFSQYNETIDKLLADISKSKNDTNKVNLLNDLSWEITLFNSEKAYQYADEAFILATKLDFKKGIADALMNKGVFYDDRLDHVKALSFYNQALEIRQKINDNIGIASCFNNIGTVYYKKSDYDKAIENYNKALEIKTKLSDKKSIASTLINLGIIYEDKGNMSEALNNYIKALNIFQSLNDKNNLSVALTKIGNIYMYQLLLDKAIDYYAQALKINEETGNKKGIASSYNSIGVIFNKKSIYDKAIENYNKSLQICQELNDKNGIADAMNNLGTSYHKQKNYSIALNYYQKASDLYSEINDKQRNTIILFNIGSIKKDQRNYTEAIDYFQKSLILAKEIGNKVRMKDIYKNLGETYTKINKYEKAYSYDTLYASLSEKIFQEDRNKSFLEMQTKFETEKKDKEIMLLTKDNEVQSLKLAQNRLFLYAVIIGFVLVVVIVFVIFGAYRNKQKANVLLEKQKEEISAKKDEIEVKNKNLEYAYKIIEFKNKNITDSIKYAKRIQQAFLPTNEFIRKALPNSFVLYLPKDIVSGDFYWIEEVDEQIYFAVVDCTGHGVPGALMSIVGYNLLNQALYENNIRKPSEILDYLSEGVYHSLCKSYDHELIKDGMDLALCKIDFKNNILEYAGVNNHLYLMRNGVLLEVCPDRRPIGNLKSPVYPDDYKNNVIDVFKGDLLYIFTDGYIDQFGGPKYKKYLTKRFKELLLNIKDLPMHKQYEAVLNEHNQWKGEIEQIDDILILGVKV